MRSIRVAIVTGIVVIRVPVDPVMVSIDLALVAVFMALDAAEDREIIGVRVTCTACVPYLAVRPVIDREIEVMIKGRGIPSRCVMTKRAIDRELRRNVVGVRRSVVIRHVASLASGGCADISIGMALGAARVQMLPGQRERGVAMIEG